MRQWAEESLQNCPSDESIDLSDETVSNCVRYFTTYGGICVDLEKIKKIITNIKHYGGFLIYFPFQTK